MKSTKRDYAFIYNIGTLEKSWEKFGSFILIYLFCPRLADFEYVRWAVRGVAETWIQLARWAPVAVVAGCLSPQGERD